jgi:putative exporter of polyketide antibiotics
MLGAGLNVIPTALLVLGVGALTLSVYPRAAGRSVYFIVVWSLLADLMGSLVESLSWLDHLSLFHYMALAPAQDPDPAAIAVTLSIAPRLAARAVYGIVLWSLLVDLLGSMIESISWIDHLSLFHYMALAPAQGPDPTAITVTLVVAAALCALATLIFDRRDLQTA